MKKVWRKGEKKKPISTGGEMRKSMGQFAVDSASENTGQQIFQTEVMPLPFLEATIGLLRESQLACWELRLRFFFCSEMVLWCSMR